MDIEESKILLKDFQKGKIEKDKLEHYRGSYKMGYFYTVDIQEALETVLSELEKKEAIINLMAKQLVEAHGWFYSEFDNFTEKDWIDYCRKKVTDINVGDIPEQN